MVKSKQLVFQEEARDIFRHFSSLLQIRVSFFNLDGTEITVSGSRPHCDYCHFLHEYLNRAPSCHAFDAKMVADAAAGEEPLVYTCPGGMTGIATPVISHGRPLCVILLGQFRQVHELPEELQLDQDNKELLEVFAQTPYFAPDKIQDIVGLVHMQVKLISEQGLVQVSHDPLAPLLEYIEEHPQQTLSLQEAARIIHRSISSLSHLFKKRTGKGFREFQIEHKLSLADRYLRTEPQLAVSEIADRLGYEDPLYFSKLYRRHRGFSPKAARERSLVGVE